MVALNREDNIFFHELYMENYAKLKQYAFYNLKNEDLAKDVAQETFLVALTKMDQLKVHPNPSGWLRLTISHIIGDTFRRRKRLSAESISLQQVPEKGEGMDIDVRTEYSGLISEEELQLLIWLYYEGHSYEEIAGKLGISVSACKKRAQRAKERFRKAFEQDLSDQLSPC